MELVDFGHKNYPYNELDVWMFDVSFQLQNTMT